MRPCRTLLQESLTVDLDLRQQFLKTLFGRLFYFNLFSLQSNRYTVLVNMNYHSIE